MDSDLGRVAQPALGKLVRLAWKCGAGWEKLFAALSILVFPIGIAIEFVVVREAFRAGWPLWSAAIVVLGTFSLVFFNQAVLRPMYGRRALRILDQRGWGPARPGYYAELARYIERYGQDGRLPWVVRWGLASWLLFYLFIVVGVWLSLALNPFLGVWSLLAYSAVIYPLGFLWWRAYRRRIRLMEEEGERRGYRLLVTAKAGERDEPVARRPG